MSLWATALCTLSTTASVLASGALSGRSLPGKPSTGFSLEYPKPSAVFHMILWETQAGCLRHEFCRMRCEGTLAMRTQAWCCSLAGLLLLSGCAGAESSISGTVNLDGKPVAEGDIRFIPMEGTAGADAGAVIRVGKYKAIVKDLA